MNLLFHIQMKKRISDLEGHKTTKFLLVTYKSRMLPGIMVDDVKCIF